MTAYLAVARIRKPHGLKGEVAVHVLTDDPAAVLAVGRRLVPLTEEGDVAGDPLVIGKSRPFHRLWLLQFEGIDDRPAMERWRQRLLGVPSEELAPPGEDEIYVHEVAGTDVIVGEDRVGAAVDLIDISGGRLIEVELGDGRTVMVPFRDPIVRSIDRKKRRIVIDPPPGLLEL
ncbi:MAG: ribosome maturation factor RimM [Gemmatimonadales bacterium]